MLKALLDLDNGFDCPYCHNHNGVNEGSSEVLDNGDCVITCGYCGKEVIGIEE